MVETHIYIYILSYIKKVPIQLTRMYPPNWKRFFDDQLKAFSCTYMISPSQTANFAVDIGSSLAMIGPSWANPRGSDPRWVRIHGEPPRCRILPGPGSHSTLRFAVAPLGCASLRKRKLPKCCQPAMSNTDVQKLDAAKEIFAHAWCLGFGDPWDFWDRRILESRDF